MIDDVEYLLEHSELDSIPFFVDSNSRKKEFYRTPSEYQVEFALPFKFVVGFEVLDATIPTTMYNIDYINNTFAVSIFTSFQNEYTGKTLFRELAPNIIFSHIFEKRVKLTTIYVIPETLPPLEDEIIRLEDMRESDVKFIAVRHETAIPAELVTREFDRAHGDTVAYFLSEGHLYSIERTPSNNEYVQIIDKDNFFVDALDTQTRTYAVKYYTYHRVHDDEGSPATNMMTIENHYDTLAVGNYDISTLRSALNQLYSTRQMKFEGTVTDDRQSLMRIVTNRFFLINAAKGTMSSNLGYGVYPRDTIRVRENQQIHMADESNLQYSLTPESVVNLLGERYVILRVDEIEDHLLGSYAHVSSTATGVAMFKLAANANDLTNLRFDFVNLVRKPFHPIGKLSKITLRFETAAGNLYDFKGVNHQLMIMVKILVPKQRVPFTHSVLNPSYDPNLVKYMFKQPESNYLENTYYNTYKKKMEDYESSEDESSSD